MEQYIDMLKNTLNFRGKVNRRDFWIATLVNILFSFCAGLIALPFILEFKVFVATFTSLVGLYEVVLFLPTLSLAVRRLHDAGYAGYYVCFWILPVVGSILLLVLLCKPSASMPKVTIFGTPNQPQQPQDLNEQNEAEQSQLLAQNSEQTNTALNDEKQLTKAKESEPQIEPQKQEENLLEKAPKQDERAKVSTTRKPRTNKPKTQTKTQAKSETQMQQAQPAKAIKTADDDSLKNQTKAKSPKQQNAPVFKTRGEQIRQLQQAKENGEISEDEYRSRVIKILK